MVFADVRAVLHLALVADAGSHDLGETIDVEAFQAQTLLNLLTHAFGPRLSAKGTDAQLDLFFRDTNLVHGLG